MKRILLIAAIVLLQGQPASAGTIRGNLINGSASGPASASSVRLVDMSKGMDQIGTLMDVEGRFEFKDVPSRDGAPYLIQVQSGGVLYSQTVNLPDQEAAIDFTVYESTDDLSQIVVSLYHVIFQRNDDVLSVMEFLEFTNNTDPPYAVWRDGGPITVEVPTVGDEPAQVQVSTTGGMPLRQELLETMEDGVYTVPQALKPGVTRVVIQTTADYSAGAFEWSPAMHHPVATRSVLISPDDVQVTGAGLQRSTTKSPITGYAVYEGGPLAIGGKFDVRLEGGSDHAVDPHAGVDMSGSGGGADDGHDHNTHSQITEVRVRSNPLSARRAWIMGGLGAVLLFGLAVGLQRPNRRDEPRRAAERKISRLEDRFLAGELDRAAFEAERARLAKPSAS